MNERALAYERTASSACWWWPHRDFVMVSERPTLIARDADGQLHSEIGPAIVWPDGWGLWSWHGTTIPREWLEQRDQLRPETALTWPQIEQRRCAAELIGWAKVLDSLPTRVIDEDRDPTIGKLVNVDLPDAPNEQFLLVRCPTGRDFAICVTGEGYKTALDAQAGINQVPKSLYRQLENRS